MFNAWKFLFKRFNQIWVKKTTKKFVSVLKPQNISNNAIKLSKDFLSILTANFIKWFFIRKGRKKDNFSLLKLNRKEFLHPQYSVIYWRKLFNCLLFNFHQKLYENFSCRPTNSTWIFFGKICCPSKGIMAKILRFLPSYLAVSLKAFYCIFKKPDVIK
jgi:hypothetical protein